MRFESSLAKYIEDFIEYKRLQQYKYNNIYPIKIFDKFLSKNNYELTYLTRDIVDKYYDYLSNIKVNTSINTRCVYLYAVRQFSFFLQHHHFESYVLNKIQIKKIKKCDYYIYNDEDINKILYAAKKLRPFNSLNSKTYYTLFGLLYTNGLRISEAININIDHVMPEQKVILIKNSKLAKDRYIVLSDSTTEIIKQYLEVRKKYLALDNKQPLFITKKGKRLKYDTIRRKFKSIVEICFPNTENHYRIHDLRHSYAVNCLLKWYREGKDVNANLPILSRAMGHVNITCTYIYLHLVPQLANNAITLLNKYLG